MLANPVTLDPLPSMDTHPDTLTPVGAAAHPGAGGLKARIRASLFGGDANQKIGRYRITRSLASGGMGTVFLAEDAELGRPVALKLVRYDRVAAHTQARLLREAQGLAKLAHPNVVAIYEVGVHEQLLFMAMEYVEGVSLRRWLEAEAHPWASIVEVFEQAAAGLAAAHRAGLVHRDFKPDNVLVGADGRVRIVDFGLVTMAGDDEPAQGSENSDAPVMATQMVLTQTGELIGTPAYMAPEQFLGERPTPASDQFSLFVALYEALAGARPFVGASVDELMRAVLDGDARPLQVPAIPASLRRAIARGLAREPGDRFADMDAAVAALRSARAPRARRWPIAAAILAISGGLAALVYAREPVSPDDFVAAAAAAPVLPSTTGDDQGPAQAALAVLLATEDEDARLELADAYLDDYAVSGGPGRRLIAEAIRGQIRWERSCPSAWAGLCVTVTPASEGLGRCEEHPVIRKVDRTEVGALGLEQLRLADQLAGAGPTLDDPDEALALAEAIGAATAVLADAKLEDYLELHPPRGLDFGSSDEHMQLSKDAFAAFITQKTAAGQALVEAYAQAKRSGSPTWIVHAAARTGLAYADLANALASIPIPRDFVDESERTRYCEALATQTAPIRTHAEQAFEFCATQAEAAGLDPQACAATALEVATSAPG